MLGAFLHQSHFVVESDFGLEETNRLVVGVSEDLPQGLTVSLGWA